MGEQQWCLQVNRKGAEEIRKKLLDEGILDRTLKIRPEGDDLLFPIYSEREGAIRAEFERLTPRIDLPRHEQVGGIAVLQEDSTDQADLILSQRSSVHTVLFAESNVEGEFRTRRFKILAGKKTTATTITEYGKTFRIDLERAYFSARLASERQRIVEMMEKEEEVLDMFAGVGPFAIMLAKKASVVWACDLNPGAVSLLIENIALNRITNVIPILGDAAILPSLWGKRFDRVIMNLPLHADKFLDDAFSLCKPGGTIHFYALVPDDEEESPLLRGMTIRTVQKRFVRSYAPGRSHMVYDIIVA